MKGKAGSPTLLRIGFGKDPTGITHLGMFPRPQCRMIFSCLSQVRAVGVCVLLTPDNVSPHADMAADEQTWGGWQNPILPECPQLQIHWSLNTQRPTALPFAFARRWGYPWATVVNSRPSFPLLVCTLDFNQVQSLSDIWLQFPALPQASKCMGTLIWGPIIYLRSLLRYSFPHNRAGG